MRPEQSRVESDAADPLGDEARILAGCHVAVRAAMTSKQELAGPFAGVFSLDSHRLLGGSARSIQILRVIRFSSAALLRNPLRIRPRLHPQPGWQQRHSREACCRLPD
jgi:hypothetical protein